MTVAVSGDTIFAGDAVGEFSLGGRAVRSNAARADLTRSVAYDPRRASSDFALCGIGNRLEPESGPF
jgi:hypothetical protein